MYASSLPAKERIDSLTGLRTLAAAWVVIFHFKDEILKFFPNLPGFLFHFINTGWLGVDVFFVLSGFVISYNYTRTFANFSVPVYLRYLWLRLARIYPLHLAVLAAYGLLLLIAARSGNTINNPEDFTVSSLIVFLLLVQAWGFGLDGWNKPAWSITAEWFAYLMFPITRNLTARLNTVGLLMCSLIALALVPVIAGVITGTPAEKFVNLTRIICEFTTGSCLYWLYLQRFAGDWNWSLLTPLSVLAVLAVAMLFSSVGVTPFWATLPIGLMVFALTQNQGVVSAWLSSKVMIFFGQVSFALYMTHLLTRSLLTRVLKPDSYLDANILVRLGILLAFFAGITLVAIVAYLLLEEPARNAMRKFYDRRFAIRREP